MDGMRASKVQNADAGSGPNGHNQYAEHTRACINNHTAPGSAPLTHTCAAPGSWCAAAWPLCPPCLIIGARGSPCWGRSCSLRQGVWGWEAVWGSNERLKAVGKRFWAATGGWGQLGSGLGLLRTDRWRPWRSKNIQAAMLKLSSPSVAFVHSRVGNFGRLGQWGAAGSLWKSQMRMVESEPAQVSN